MAETASRVLQFAAAAWRCAKCESTPVIGKRVAGEAGRDAREARREDEGSGVLHNVTLEISGVAYLINPPNLAKLGIKAADATAGAVRPRQRRRGRHHPPLQRPL